METRLKSLHDDLQQAAFDLGFPLFGVVAATESPGFSKFCQWLDRGYAGGMDYLNQRRSAYRHPSSVLEVVKTLVMLGIPYQPAKSRRRKRNRHSTPEQISKSTNLNSPHDVLDSQSSSRVSMEGAGRVAAYATGVQDYHDLIHQRLRQLSSCLIERYPRAKVRGVVDTAPLLEREFAALAGLGWVGKNTLLLNRRAGSYFFIAALLTDIEINERPTMTVDHCGNCTACLDACPTQAFPQPYVLDATRCISYLTIEHRGPIPNELRESMGNWVFGCDICQQVCPWNRMAKPTDEIAFQPQPQLEAIDLLELLSLDDTAFRRIYRKTPLWRTRRIGMQRNAMLALGNQRSKVALPMLVKQLSSDDETLRRTAAWAIGRIGGEVALAALRERSLHETSSAVQLEIVEALEFKS